MRYHVHLNSTDMYLSLPEEPSDNFRRISRECLSLFALETFPRASCHAKALADLDLVPRTHVLYTAACLEEALFEGPDTWFQLSMDKKMLGFCAVLKTSKKMLLFGVQFGLTLLNKNLRGIASARIAASIF